MWSKEWYRNKSSGPKKCSHDILFIYVDYYMKMVVKMEEVHTRIHGWRETRRNWFRRDEDGHHDCVMKERCKQKSSNVIKDSAKQQMNTEKWNGIIINDTQPISISFSLAYVKMFYFYKLLRIFCRFLF